MTGNKTKAIDIAQQRRQRLTGIALMCGAVALFACLDTTAKYLNTHMDAMQITWARYTSAFVLTLFVSNPFTHTGLLRTARPKLQIIRSLLLLVATVGNFLALRWLQLDEVLSIIFTFPSSSHRLRAAAGRMDPGGAGRRSASALVACC
jgi:hypothetical protein